MVTKFLTKIDELTEGKTLIIGLLGLLASTLIATFSQTHFDRIIMPHQSLTRLPYYVPFFELLCNVFVFSFVLWGAAKYWSEQRVSVITMINRQLFARIPLSIPPLFFLFPTLQNFLLSMTTWWTGSGEQPKVTPVIIALITGLLICTMVAIFLFIRLSFEGFVKCANLERRKVKITYIGSLLLAELLSNWIIVKLFIA